eukprot:c53979_g1_i1.p1 GENE.c53979_g1_i1~~c53979_g1_i1.p1  ORF type:complete len:404 (-),score=90.04 c53979_g1_i1:15-1226(-)
MGKRGEKHTRHKDDNDKHKPEPVARPKSAEPKAPTEKKPHKAKKGEKRVSSKDQKQLQPDLAADHPALVPDSGVPQSPLDAAVSQVSPDQRVTNSEIQQLFRACSKDDDKTVARLLKRVAVNKRVITANLDRTQFNNWTLLHMACWFNAHNVLKCILEQPDVNVNVTLEDSRTPLHICALRNSDFCAELLLAQPKLKIDPQNSSRKGQTPLQVAALLGHSEVIRLLLAAAGDKGAAQKMIARENSNESGPKSALTLAIRFGHFAATNALLDHWTPTPAATPEVCREAVLSCNTDVWDLVKRTLYSDAKALTSCLSLACCTGPPSAAHDILTVVTENKEDWMNNDYFTPHTKVFPETLKFRLEHFQGAGLRLAKLGKRQGSILHAAVSCGKVDLVQYLLDRFPK